MKAILVIDLNANELPKDAHANVYVFGKYCEEQEDDFIACKENVPLKPMPKQKDTSFNEAFMQGYKCGWNACLCEELIEDEQ